MQKVFEHCWREHYGRVIFVLPPSSSQFYFIIHPRNTHTPPYFIKSCMFRKYLKNESIGRWLSWSVFITVHTCSNWINHNTIVRSRSHFSLSIVPRRKLVRLLFPLFGFSSCSTIFLLRRLSCSAIHYQSVVSKRHVCIRLPGLIKSNFFFTGQLKSAVVSSCSRIIFCPPLLSRVFNIAQIIVLPHYRLAQFYSSCICTVSKSNIKKREYNIWKY